MNEPDRHLTDEEIVRWVDEGDATRATVEGHLDRCEACRARVAEVEALLAALGSEPPARTDAEMAAQRVRILAAVEAMPRAPARRFRRRSVWLPAVAAAAIAALLLWAPRGTRPPAASRVADVPPEAVALPVIVEATRAAEEVAEAARDPGMVERLVEAPPLDPVEPEIAPISEDWGRTLAIEEAFAGLPAADREAILTELASIDFIHDSEE